MTAKRFPLGAVLKVRQQAEQAEERALSALYSQLKAARTMLSQHALQLSRHAAERAAECHHLFHAAHHQAMSIQWLSLRAQHTAALERIELLDKSIAEQQLRFLRARREREMLSELHEKYVKNVSFQDAKAESKRIDDLYSTRRKLSD